jgi:hypothetical protein
VRWGCETDANALRTHSDGIANASQTVNSKSPPGKKSVITLSPDTDALHAHVDTEEIRAILTGQFGGKE